MRKLKKVPFAFILAAVWAGLKAGNIVLATSSPAGVAILVACFIVMAVEFYKSGDISLHAFGVDLALALLAVVVIACTLTETVIRQGAQNLYLVDLFVTAVVVCDAWVSPFNSFRTALRNWMSNIDAGGHNTDS